MKIICLVSPRTDPGLVHSRYYLHTHSYVLTVLTYEYCSAGRRAARREVRMMCTNNIHNIIISVHRPHPFRRSNPSPPPKHHRDGSNTGIRSRTNQSRYQERSTSRQGSHHRRGRGGRRRRRRVGRGGRQGIIARSEQQQQEGGSRLDDIRLRRIRRLR